MKMNKEKNYEVILTLVTVLIIIYLNTEIHWLLIAAMCLGLAGILFYTPSSYFSRGFLFVAEIIGRVMPKIILSVVFFFILTPIAFLNKLRGADAMRLKKNSATNYVNHKPEFSKQDFENTW